MFKFEEKHIRAAMRTTLIGYQFAVRGVHIVGLQEARTPQGVRRAGSFFPFSERSL